MKRFLKTDAGLLLAILVVVTLIALPTLTYPLGRDQGEFATIGRGILHGQVPYKDLWNPKPPAVFYIYALAIQLLGQTAPAIRAIDFFIVPFISLSLFWLGRQIANRRVGLWTALIFPVFYFTESFWTLSQNDGIVLLPMVLAVVCLFKAVSGQRLAISSDAANTTSETQHSARWAVSTRSSTQHFIWLFLSGALCGYAVWFKYPFALLGAALVVGWWWINRAVGTRNFVSLQMAKNIAAFVFGGLVIGIGGILIMQAMGAWDELLLSARVTSQYTALTFNFTDFTDLMKTAIGFRWQQWGVLWILAAAWIFVRRWGEKRGKGWSIVLLWLLAGLAIMLIQAKGYDYHWLPMLPPLVLLAADTIDQILARIGTRYIPQIIVAIFFLSIMVYTIWPVTFPYLTGQEDQIAYDSHFVAGEFVADESLKVANFLREREVPGDSLYIWGFRPEVYYMSGLNPASRFIFQFPLVGSWYPPEWKQQNVDTLWAALPPYVLVLQVDYMPWVTGVHEDSNTLLQSYTELNNWLIYNYERETQIGNFFIWKRKP